jgi:polysaccharide chain length determinant protein (PEP-CTERM system associated)
LASWRRRKWLAIVVFVVPFTAAVTFAAFLPNIYESTASVLVERQQVPEGLVRPTVTGELETRLRTISQETLSRSRLETLINRFGLYPDVRHSAPTEAVIDRMRHDIRLDLRGTDPRGRGSTIAFAITYRGRDPETVAQVTNTLASFYIEQNLQVRERQATGTAQFLRGELEEARKRLDTQERRVSEFKKRYVGELPEQMQANLAAVEQLNAQLRLNSVNRMRLEERRDLIAFQMPDAIVAREGTMGPALAVDPTEARLAQLKQQVDELASRYTERHPTMLARKAEIASLEQRLAERPRVSTEGNATHTPPAAPLTPQAMRAQQALAEVQAELKVLKDEDTRLRKALAVHEHRVVNTPQREQEFLALSREYESTKDLYQSLVKRHDEAQLAESMEQRQKGEQFRVLDPALPSAVPAAPKRHRLVMMALALSLGLAVGSVVVAEQIDSSFHSVAALRRFTTVPVIAAIPLIVTVQDGRRRRRRVRLVAAGTAVALVMVATMAYVLAHGNESFVGW